MPYPLKYTGEQVDDLLDKINYLDVATQGEDGLMSSEDKTKLDNIEAGAQENVVEGISLGGAGITPVNKVINIQLDAQPTENSTNLINSGALYTKLLSYYTKTEVDAMLAVVWEPVVVSSLPTASADTMQKIYFVPSDNPETQNVKDEYITIRSGSEGSYTYSWEQIGSTAIDISGKADKDTDAVIGNLAEFDSNGNPIDAGIAAEKVAKKGEVQTFAGNLVDTRSAGTRQGPYAFRQSGGDGVDYMVRIKGRTEAWNQMFPGWRRGDSKGVSTNTNRTLDQSNNYGTTNHKYYFGFDYWGSSFSGTANVKLLQTGSSSVVESLAVTSSRKRTSYIYTCNRADTNNIEVTVSAGTFYIDNTVQFDLTLMFGAGNEPATPEAFEALHPLGYYNYNAGVLKNNAATGLETVGFNQWDEEWLVGYYRHDGTFVSSNGRICSKNWVPIFPNTNYFLKSHVDLTFFFYDADKNFIEGSAVNILANTEFTTPANARWCLWYCTYANYGNVYNHDICINRSDASRNGIYEPYWKRDIVLGLDNLACHDENNNAVVVNGLDGVGTSYDELVVENGWGTKIIKRRGRRAYQAGDESDATLMTDGTNTDYPLATPKVLTLDNPIPALIEVDNLGTEKRLPEDTADNPQGPFECDSNYSISVANLVRKLNS